MMKNFKLVRKLSTKRLQIELLDTAPIAKITLKNPPVNALTIDLLKDLGNVIEELENVEKYGKRGILLSSSNPKVFSAGLDLSRLIDPKPDEFKEYFKAFEIMCRNWAKTPLPCVVSLSGFAPAGGTVLALLCDYRIAHSKLSLSMGLNESAIGMSPPAFIYQLFKSAVKERNANYHLQLGTLFNSPQEALDIGIIDALSENPLIDAEKQLHKFMKVPWKARSWTKSITRQHILNELNPEAFEELWKSISGDEFQFKVKELMANLKK